MGVFISAGRADNNGVPKETVEETLVAVDSSSPKIAPWWAQHMRHKRQLL